MTSYLEYVNLNLSVYKAEFMVHGSRSKSWENEIRFVGQVPEYLGTGKCSREAFSYRLAFQFQPLRPAPLFSFYYSPLPLLSSPIHPEVTVAYKSV